MAASGHYLATQAALAVLDGGGNAIDAGVAGALVLGVVQSEYVHIAGVAPIMIRLAGGEVLTLSGLGWWPALSSAAYFREHHGGRIPAGIKRAVVPGAPDAYLTALQNYGTLSFGEVAAAAIRFAEQGFPVSTLMAEIIDDRSAEFLAWPENPRVYMPGGAIPEPGSLLKLPDLARSMRYMADQETAAGSRSAGLDAARHAFYRGDIAREIDRFHRDNDGWLRMEDLAAFRVEVEKPVRTRYRGADVYTCGCWCQGPVLAEALNFIDPAEIAEARHNSSPYLHRAVEALKLAFADRDAYYIDPRFGNPPIDRLVSADYAEKRRRLIDPLRANPGMPEPGSPEDLGLTPKLPQPAEWADPDLDTSYICTVDEAGNAFSCTPSDGCLSGPMVPGLGLNPSARGGQSWTDPDHPACLAPGKRPRLTPSPAFAEAPGEWFMPFGSPGNDVQPQAMLQVFLNIVEFGMPVGEAIMQPRCASYSFPATSDPHRYHPGRLSIESRVDGAVIEELRALGHDVKTWPAWEWRAGSVCAIRSDQRSGVMEGGSDLRRPGGVAGY
jgi:gamma-glutamyltranspeptidase/glutathione hydrolase